MNTNERSSSPSNISGNNINRLNNNNSKQSISKGQDLTATSNTPSLKSTRTMNSSQRQPSTIQQIESNHTPTTQSNRSILGNGNTTSSVISDLRTARGSQPIYAWEESNERTERVPVKINEITFLPSKQLGFYTRNDIINPASTTGTLLLHLVPLALLLGLMPLLLYYCNNYNV